MSQTILSVPVSDSLLRDAAEQAARAGLPVEDWFRSLAEENILYERAAGKYFSHRMIDDNAAHTLRTILDQAADEPPISGDELES